MRLRGQSSDSTSKIRSAWSNAPLIERTADRTNQWSNEPRVWRNREKFEIPHVKRLVALGLVIEIFNANVIFSTLMNWSKLEKNNTVINIHIRLTIHSPDCIFSDTNMLWCVHVTWQMGHVTLEPKDCSGKGQMTFCRQGTHQKCW